MASASASASPEQKALYQRMETYIGNIVGNFIYLVGAAPKAVMLEMRSARMPCVYIKTDSDLSGLASLNADLSTQLADKSNQFLSSLDEEANANLKELESHYSSASKKLLPNDTSTLN